MTGRIFGDIAGCSKGSTFKDRRALRIAGVHRPTQAGICGSGEEGAESIVLNGGYEDDEDGGDVIIYTGQGGIDGKTGEQVADQELTRGNLALTRNKQSGEPVHVIRGPRTPARMVRKTGSNTTDCTRLRTTGAQRGRQGISSGALSWLSGSGHPTNFLVGCASVRRAKWSSRSARA